MVAMHLLQLLKKEVSKMNNTMHKQLINQLCDYIKNDIDNTPEDKWSNLDSKELDAIMCDLSKIETRLYNLVNE